MTNKQVIYNGVDVSTCEFLTKTGHCKAQMSIMGIDANKCKCFPNCYYKQLKAKEQECESWKKANDEKNELLAKLGCPTAATAKMKAFTLKQQLDQLKVQLLDQKVKTLKASGIICVLEQTLAEIKKICNSVENIENVNSLYDAKLSGMYLQANKILQKIIEV